MYIFKEITKPTYQFIIFHGYSNQLWFFEIKSLGVPIKPTFYLCGKKLSCITTIQRTLFIR